jgi:hypothetical protein
MDRWRRLAKDTHYERVGELRDLSEQELIEKYDAWMVHVNKLPPSDKTALTNRAQTYMNELHRRETLRQGERMEALTRSLNRLTWFIAGATVVGVILTALALIFG